MIGSQALLVARPDIDRRLRKSNEIDAYPANLHGWQKENDGQEASEVINALLGEGSSFHQKHGYFVDGVDDTTAKLAPDWMERLVQRLVIVDEQEIEIIAPHPDDIVAAKLARGDPKDISFARLCFQQGIAKYGRVRRLLEMVVAEDESATALSRLRVARHPDGKG